MAHEFDDDAIDPLQALREECARELPAGASWDDVLAATAPLSAAERARLKRAVLGRSRSRTPLAAATAAGLALLAVLLIYPNASVEASQREASRLTALAGAQSRDGHYAQAETLYKRALELQERALGPEHVAVASTLTELAELYASQQLYAKAKPLYNRAFSIQPTQVF